MAESKEVLKSILIRMKEDSLKKKKKTGLELNIQETKIIASGSITSCQTEGEKWKQ